MAKRAKEAFVLALIPKGKAVFQKDQVVPDDLAKRCAALVYDDGAPKKSKGAAPSA